MFKGRRGIDSLKGKHIVHNDIDVGSSPILKRRNRQKGGGG
jgi:hypothetical protein